MVRTGLRALLWLAASGGLLLAGFALFGAVLLGLSLLQRGTAPGPVGWEALGLVYQTIAVQALLPELGFTLASWLALAFVWPAPERSLLGLGLGLAGVAALWFPLVGERFFTVWQSAGPATYAATAALVAGGAAAAAWLARVALPALPPGCFAARGSRDIVEP
ncbi:MAG TPA: hypothetical protein VMS55_13575 [Myxococcota bacterium]|nr:hypothetical protein [Myxococcota bacterium]